MNLKLWQDLGFSLPPPSLSTTTLIPPPTSHLSHHTRYKWTSSLYLSLLILPPHLSSPGCSFWQGKLQALEIEQGEIGKQCGEAEI